MSGELSPTVNYAVEARKFFEIQMARYLDGRSSRTFSGRPEHDAVMAMIKDAWVELRTGSCLASLSEGGREAVYCTTLIIFPTFVADSGLQCIPVDFISRQRVGDKIIAAPMRPSLGQ